MDKTILGGNGHIQMKYSYVLKHQLERNSIEFTFDMPLNDLRDDIFAV